MTKSTTDDDACPCGRGPNYDGCCGVFHAGKAAPDAETLMRSRYSAYVKRLEKYLILTWHPRTRPSSIDLDDRISWTGLTVLRFEKRGKERAVVAFVARFVDPDGVEGTLEEVSRFVLERARWFYVDGELE